MSTIDKEATKMSQAEANWLTDQHRRQKIYEVHSRPINTDSSSQALTQVRLLPPAQTMTTLPPSKCATLL
jgi:hypothetical protein